MAGKEEKHRLEKFIKLLRWLGEVIFGLFIAAVIAHYSFIAGERAAYKEIILKFKDTTPRYYGTPSRDKDTI